MLSGLVQSFFSQIFDVATLPGDHPQGDLVTVGYRPPAMKVKKKKKIKKKKSKI